VLLNDVVKLAVKLEVKLIVKLVVKLRQAQGRQVADALSLPSGPVMTDALRALAASAVRVSRTPGPRRRASRKARESQ
jgi:hypothetical protein